MWAIESRYLNAPHDVFEPICWFLTREGAERYMQQMNYQHPDFERRIAQWVRQKGTETVSGES